MGVPLPSASTDTRVRDHEETQPSIHAKDRSRAWAWHWMTVRTVRRFAYTAVHVVAAGVLIYMALWASVIVVELAVLETMAQKTESFLPPPGDPWLRVPTLMLALAGTVWVARRAWQDQLLISPRWSLVVLLATGGGALVMDQKHEADYLQCTSADAAGTPKEQRHECFRYGNIPDQGLGVDSDTLLVAGDQACAWLEDRPWGEPPDADISGSMAAESLAVHYEEHLATSGGVLTSEESLSSRVALPAWYRLCPFQQNVHHGDTWDD